MPPYAPALRNFRQQLGLEDADAANAHIEVGRRLFRKRIELGDKAGGVARVEQAVNPVVTRSACERRLGWW